MQARARNAFTLIELSIVLIIIGLLVGGVLAGRELITQAKLRAVTSEWQEYQTATHTYNLKYDTKPGDHNRATSFFSGTANGDGDQTLDTANSGSNEPWLFFQHLALAGLIEGSYTGTSGSGHAFRDAVIGENTPASAYDGAGWSVHNTTGTDAYGADPKAEIFFLGDASPAAGQTSNPLIPNEQLSTLDNKYDDGLANQGKIRTSEGFGGADCTTGTAPNHSYSTNTDAACTSLFLFDF